MDTTVVKARKGHPRRILYLPLYLSRIPMSLTFQAPEMGSRRDATADHLWIFPGDGAGLIMPGARNPARPVVPRPYGATFRFGPCPVRIPG
jgi:hypothetical protein